MLLKWKHLLFYALRPMRLNFFAYLLVIPHLKYYDHIYLFIKSVEMGENSFIVLNNP